MYRLVLLLCCKESEHRSLRDNYFLRRTRETLTVSRARPLLSNSARVLSSYGIWVVGSSSELHTSWHMQLCICMHGTLGADDGFRFRSTGRQERGSIESDETTGPCMVRERGETNDSITTVRKNPCDESDYATDEVGPSSSTTAAQGLMWFGCLFPLSQLLKITTEYGVGPA